jgi:hypothetical protein
MVQLELKIIHEIYFGYSGNPISEEGKKVLEYSLTSTSS